MDDEKVVDWSWLPLELWPKIGISLDNRIDILRFRSVCESWRSSIPPSPSPSPSPSFPLIIPHPYLPNHLLHSCYLNLSTIYLLQPPTQSSNGFLIMVSESQNLSNTLLFSPISGHRVMPMNHGRYLGHCLYHRRFRRSRRLPPSPIPPLPPPPMSLVLNLLDYRVFEVSKSYTIGSPDFSVRKVVFLQDSSVAVACCVFMKGGLGLMKHGDEKWSLLDDKNCDDVIVFKGKFYVTDKGGTISWVDISSNKLVRYSPPLCGFGNMKHLIESCGSLYVVDRYYETDQRFTRWENVTRVAAVKCFKVYKLDEEWGRTWVNVNDLGDRVFILGRACNFSVSAKDVRGYQGNCIYFNDVFYLYDVRIRMYNLQDGSIITIEIELDPTTTTTYKMFMEEIRGPPESIKCLWRRR